MQIDYIKEEINIRTESLKAEIDELKETQLQRLSIKDDGELTIIKLSEFSKVERVDEEKHENTLGYFSAVNEL